MSDWLDEKVEKIKQQDGRLARQQRLHLHNAEVIKAKGPAWWHTFGEFLERELDGYNDSFRSDTPRQLKCSSPLCQRD